ncbi:MAG: hypothetical protein IMF07_02055 [Proteobacteria bacterium]|nr:hypothetical protein [Pseudomonadota bacterium]
MYRRYIFRGGISFLVGGILFGLIQPIYTLTNVLIKDVMSFTALGTIGAYYLAIYSDNAERVAYYAAAGFAIAGIIFNLISYNPTIDAAIAGLIGGAALGMGWRDMRYAKILGASSAILVPFTFYLHNVFIPNMQGNGMEVSGSVFITIPALFFFIVLNHFAFMVFGFGIAAVLACLDSKNNNKVDVSTHSTKLEPAGEDTGYNMNFVQLN